jgi:hypothetical protein
MLNKNSEDLILRVLRLAVDESACDRLSTLAEALDALANQSVSSARRAEPIAALADRTHAPMTTCWHFITISKLGLSRIL